MLPEWPQCGPRWPKMTSKDQKWSQSYPKHGFGWKLDGIWWRHGLGWNLDGIKWSWVELNGSKREAAPLSPAQFVLTELNTFGESKTSVLKMKLEPLAFIFSTLLLSDAIWYPNTIVDHFKLFRQLFTVHLCGCRKRTIILDGNQGCGTLTAHFIRKLQVMQILLFAQWAPLNWEGCTPQPLLKLCVEKNL